MRGIVANITSVSNHPLTKATANPPMNVNISWRNLPTCAPPRIEGKDNRRKPKPFQIPTTSTFATKNNAITLHARADEDICLEEMISCRSICKKKTKKIMQKFFAQDSSYLLTNCILNENGVTGHSPYHRTCCGLLVKKWHILSQDGLQIQRSDACCLSLSSNHPTRDL